MPSLRSSFAALVAGSLLFAGPALAARTQPATLRTGRPATTARRSATARLGAAAKAATPAGDKGARYAGAPAVATLPMPNAAEALPAVAEPKFVCLAGVVLAPNGKPCAGACVFATTNTRQMTVTDADGNFQLQVPVQSTLTVQADFLGRGSSQVAIDSHIPQPVRLVLAR